MGRQKAIKAIAVAAVFVLGTLMSTSSARTECMVGHVGRCDDQGVPLNELIPIIIAPILGGTAVLTMGLSFASGFRPRARVGLAATGVAFGLASLGTGVAWAVDDSNDTGEGVPFAVIYSMLGGLIVGVSAWQIHRNREISASPVVQRIPTGGLAFGFRLDW